MVSVMNKVITVLGAIAISALAVVSCNKANNTVEEPQLYEYTFIVGNGDAATATPETRALLGSDDNGLFLSWESTDALNTWAHVSGENYSYNNKSTIDASTTPVTFTIKSFQKLDAGATVYASYSGDFETNNNRTPISHLEIPATQAQAGTSFVANAMPMVAKPFPISNAIQTQNGTSTESDAVMFYNMGGIIEFDIYSPSGAYADESIQSVTFEANKDIAGTFDFDLRTVNADDLSSLNFSLANSSDAETSIVTEVSQLTVGASCVSVSSAAKVYMVVAPGTYSGTVTVKTKEAVYVYPISSEKTFDRANAKRLGINLEKSGARSDIPDYVVLPWESAEEGEGLTKSELDAIVGVSVNAGSDYGSGPCFVKFDGTGKNIVIKTDSQIGTVSVDVKGNGTDESSKIIISGSADGETWTEVQRFGLVNNQVITLNTTSVFAATDRFVKIEYYKSSGNAGIGRICITKANTEPYIYAEDVTVPAIGVESEIATYEARNFVDDVIVPEVNGVTGCVSEAYAEDGEIIYCVEPNYTTSPVSGTIVLCSQSNPSVTKTINVTQAASVFEASSTDAMAFAWDDKTNSEEKTVTITSTFTLTKTDNVVLSGTDAAKFSVSLTPVSNSTDEYTLSVSVNEDNVSEAAYEAVVTISRNDLEIAINLSQAKKITGDVKTEFTWSASSNQSIEDGSETATDGTGTTVSWAKGEHSSTKVALNTDGMRLYSGSTFTVANASKKISKIEFTIKVNVKNGKYPEPSATVGTLTEVTSSSKSMTWTGSSNTVAISFSEQTGNVAISKIVVSYE